MPKRSPFYLIPQIVLLLVILLPALSWAGDFELRLGGDKLTLRADETPLQTILRKFSDYGVKVRIDPRINPTITVSIDNQDVQRGIAVLLKSLNYSLVWKSSEGPSGPSGPVHGSRYAHS
jgi:type II secretory pathway component GspD/PulD (secretin)